jgi:hypothetical protein
MMGLKVEDVEDGREKGKQFWNFIYFYASAYSAIYCCIYVSSINAARNYWCRYSERLLFLVLEEEKGLYSIGRLIALRQ